MSVEPASPPGEPVPESWLVKLLRQLGFDLTGRPEISDAELLAALPEAIALCELVYAADGAVVDFRYLQCNEAFARHIGRPLADVLGRTSGDISLRLHVSALTAASRASARGNNATVEYSDPGTQTWYQASLHGHRASTFLLVLRDVTERKRAQTRTRPLRPADPILAAVRPSGPRSPAEAGRTAAPANRRTAPPAATPRVSAPAAATHGAGELLARLTASENRLNFALEAAQMGVWSRNLKTNLYTGSEGIFRLLNLPQLPGEQNPRMVFEAMHPEDRPVVARAMVLANQEGKVPNAEFRVVHEDGSIGWVEVRGGVVRDAEGRPAHAIGIAMDITQRKTMEVALARANRAHKLLSAGSVSVMRAETEDGLLHAACGVLVGTNGYRMSTIGYAMDDADQSVALMASAGTPPAWLAATRPSWGALRSQDRPVEVAIRESRPEVVRDIAKSTAVRWREGALANGFIANAALPLMDGGRAFGALTVYADDASAFDTYEIGLLEELANVVAYGVLALRARLQHDAGLSDRMAEDARLRESLEASIQAIASTIEMRDAFTAGHQRRVAALAAAIADEMALPEATKHGLHLAAIVHDVGKIRIPAEILGKPGRLNAPERALVEMHAEIGFDILKDVRLPWPIAEIVRQHHERMDGSGYPRGLRGDAILLEARIIAVADVMEAMASPRPYRVALGIEAALDEVRKLRGRVLDERVVDACVAVFEHRRFAFPDALAGVAAMAAN